MSDATRPADGLPLAQLVVSAAATTAACRCCRRWAFYCPCCGHPVLGQVDPDDVLPTVAGVVCDSCNTPALVTIAAFTTSPQAEEPTPASVTANGLNPVEHLLRCLQIRPAARPPAGGRQPDRPSAPAPVRDLPEAAQECLRLTFSAPDGAPVARWLAGDHPLLDDLQQRSWAVPDPTQAHFAFLRLFGRRPYRGVAGRGRSRYSRSEMAAVLVERGTPLDVLLPLVEPRWRDPLSRLARWIEPYRQEAQ